MNVFAEKNPKTEEQSVITEHSSANDHRITVYTRPERTTLQQLGDNSVGVQQLRTYQDMANDFTSQAVQRKVNETGLPDNLKTGIEQLSGVSMNDVKVHYNSSQPAQLNAHAYAQGTNIHLASGQEKHLPHEAWHVVQQKQGRVKPTMQLKGKVAINDDAGLEKEADEMGNLALQRKESSYSIPFNVENPVSSSADNGVAQLYKISYFKAATPTTLVKNGKPEDEVTESDGAMIENITQKDYETAGSATNDKVRTVSRFMSNMTGVSFIAGHMLNKHLLGEGNINENITSITASANSQQSKKVEEPAKAAVRAPGSDVTYWTKVTHRGNVGKDDNNYAAGHALQIETGYVNNNDKTGITELINTVTPVKAKKPFMAGGFGGEIKKGGTLDKLADAKATTLSYITDELKEFLNPKDAFLLFQKAVGGKRLYEEHLNRYYPNIPDSAIQVYGNWKASGSYRNGPSEDDLFKELNSLGGNIWLDIFVAIKYPKETLWEKLDAFIKIKGEVPHDDPRKTARFILEFKNIL
ncbi:MAG: DUF4157 domain-containing protein [Bacteroidota bacterium]